MASEVANPSATADSQARSLSVAPTPPHLRAAPTPHSDTANAPPYSKTLGFSFRVSGRRPGARREKVAGKPIPGAQDARPPQARALSGSPAPGAERSTPPRPWLQSGSPSHLGRCSVNAGEGGEGALTSNPEPRPSHCCQAQPISGQEASLEVLKWV